MNHICKMAWNFQQIDTCSNSVHGGKLMNILKRSKFWIQTELFSSPCWVITPNLFLYARSRRCCISGYRCWIALRFDFDKRLGRISRQMNLTALASAGPWLTRALSLTSVEIKAEKNLCSHRSQWGFHLYRIVLDDWTVWGEPLKLFQLISPALTWNYRKWCHFWSLGPFYLQCI